MAAALPTRTVTLYVNCMAGSYKRYTRYSFEYVFLHLPISCLRRDKHLLSFAGSNAALTDGRCNFKVFGVKVVYFNCKTFPPHNNRKRVPT